MPGGFNGSCGNFWFGGPSGFDESCWSGGAGGLQEPAWLSGPGVSTLNGSLGISWLLFFHPKISKGSMVFDDPKTLMV